MKFPKYGLVGFVPASGYALFAAIIGTSEMNCGGLFLCGYAFYLLTYPSQATLGEYLSARGIEINFSNEAHFSDYVQLALHIAVCATAIFLFFYLSARLVGLLRKYDASIDRPKARLMAEPVIPPFREEPANGPVVFEEVSQTWPGNSILGTSLSEKQTHSEDGE